MPQNQVKNEKDPTIKVVKIKKQGPAPKKAKNEPEKENNENTTLFQLLHAENRNLRWK